MNAPTGNLRLDECPRRTQYDHVPEGEPVLAACAALGFHEAGIDQASDRTAREVQNALYIAHTVGRHRSFCHLPEPIVCLPFAQSWPAARHVSAPCAARAEKPKRVRSRSSPDSPAALPSDR